MGTNIWLGQSAAVAQVNTITVGGTAAAGQTYTVTFNSKTVTYTAVGGDTNNTIASGLQTLLAASTIAEFAEVTWTVATNVVTGTMKVAGVPFTNTSSASGTGTLVTATTTASKGKHHIDDTGNWSLGALPVTGDDLFFQNSSVSAKYGGSALAGVNPATVNVEASYTGEIGLPRTNSGGYVEYRPQEVQFGGGAGAITVHVGQGAGTGSGRLRLNTGAAQTTLNLYRTAASVEVGVPALRWRGTHASNTLNVYRGSIGVATGAGESATVATLRVGYIDGRDSDADVRCGPGTTLTTLEQTGGTLEVNSAFTTATKTGGTLTVNGTGAVTTINNRGRGSGVVFYNSTGTLTTANSSGDDGDGFDFAQDMRPKTVTTFNRFGRTLLRDPFKVVTFTNGIDCEEGDTNNLDIGTHVKVTRGTPT